MNYQRQKEVIMVTDQQVFDIYKLNKLIKLTNF